MLVFHKRMLWWTVLFLLMVQAGCGDGGPTLVQVTGTLNHKGKPVPNASVTFMPEGGKGRPSSGETDETGHFKLSYDQNHEGAVVGKNVVYVTAMPSRKLPTTRKEQEAAIMHKTLPMSKDMTDFYEKYSSKNSKYEVVVDKSKPEITLNLD
jgi:hypothetical protein